MFGILNYNQQLGLESN